MAIYHLHAKVKGRSGGTSIISISAYRNAAKMRDNELGISFDFTRKRNVIDTELLYCENAPDEWKQVPQEEIEKFKETKRYKNTTDKEKAVARFITSYRKQILWHEVLKVEKNSNAQLAREIEVSIPYECSLEEGKQLVLDFVQKHFVNKGMCADIAWHKPDKETKNPHAHILLTTRAIKKDGTWAPKEKKDYARDEHGEKIPVIDPETGQQQIRDRGTKGKEKVWKRVTVEANDWNSKEKLLEWRKEWADECNKYLEPENHIDHRSYKERGIKKVATVKEGPAARKIEEQGGVSWVCELNRNITKANKDMQLLQKQADFIFDEYEELANKKEVAKIAEFRSEGRGTGTVLERNPDYRRFALFVEEAEPDDRGTSERVGDREEISKYVGSHVEESERYARQRSLQHDDSTDRRKQRFEETDKAISRTTSNGHFGRCDEISGAVEFRERKVGRANRVHAERFSAARNRLYEGFRRFAAEASRTEEFVKYRVRIHTEQIREFIEGAIQKIENRVAELIELRNRYNATKKEQIHSDSTEPETPDTQTPYNGHRRKGR